MSARLPHSVSAIGTAPLVGICAGLVLVAVPLAAKFAGWVIGLFLVAIAARLVMNHRSQRMPSLPAKLVVIALSGAGIAATYGSLLGIEPLLSVLLILVSLKLLETNGVRDFQVLALLGFFLALCGLFFSQELIAWIYVAGVLLVLIATLIGFHRDTGAAGLRPSARLAVVMLAQALPIVALLFLLFPRTYGGFRFQFSRSILNAAGMTDRLSPGSVSSLALSDAIAFRADFPDGTTPSTADMYWRGGVLWRGDGLTWVAGPALAMERRIGQLAGPSFRQRISLQPHGTSWLFALDRPAIDVRGAIFRPGGYLQSLRPIFNTLHYEVVSRPENRELTLLPDQRQAALALAGPVSPEVQALVGKWTAGATSERAVVDAALRHFGEEAFSYTLQPGTYGEDALDEFLFQRRTGFCEHYAAAFATLMRVAGVPARIVLGYHGGDFNKLGQYVIVRQAHAHAWCEVWLRDTGWVRIDPTEAIAPERISAGLETYFESRGNQAAAAAGGGAARARWRDAMQEVRLAWDSINYHWDLHVQNYDEENQRAFLAMIGFGRYPWSGILAWSALAIALVLGVLGLWLRRSARTRGDETARAYGRFCRALSAAGVEREPWEGPLHFAERAALAFPEHAATLRALGAQYAALRYAPAPPPPARFTAAVRSLPRLRSAATAASMPRVSAPT